MSFFPGKDPAAGDAPACDAIDMVIVPRSFDGSQGSPATQLDWISAYGRCSA